MPPKVVLGICQAFVITKSLDRARPLAESNSPPTCGPTGYFNGMGPDQDSAGR